jgi:hypothetical protein
VIAGKSARSFLSRLKSKWWVVWWSIKNHIPSEFYKFLTSLINWDCMKDEFSKLAHILCILWGKRKSWLTSHKPRESIFINAFGIDAFFKSSSFADVIQLFKRSWQQYLMTHLCKIYFHKNHSPMFILLNCCLSPISQEDWPPKQIWKWLYFKNKPLGTRL